MKILICVSASIAIYKTCELIRLLTKENHDVKVVLSESAEKMISSCVFEALGTEVFLKDTGKMEHITLSRWCDLLILCPATASTIGNIANGIGGTLLLDIFLAKKPELPTFICPSMNVEMWNNPIVQENIAKLKKYNFQIIEPESGILACGEDGYGKLASIENVLKYLLPKKNIRVIITAGGTIEKLDDVRYLTNISSGKQALALANEFFDCNVTIIKGSTKVEFPSWCNVVNIESSSEMLDAVEYEIRKNCDIFISCAAVADFTFQKKQGKVKKQHIQNLELIPTVDILKYVCENANRPKCVVGFAAESENLQQNATIKLHNKKCDFIVANSLVFESDSTNGIIIDNNSYEEFSCSKNELAKKIKEKSLKFL